MRPRAAEAEPEPPDGGGVPPVGREAELDVPVVGAGPPVGCEAALGVPVVGAGPPVGCEAVVEVPVGGEAMLEVPVGGTGPLVGGEAMLEVPAVDGAGELVPPAQLFGCRACAEVQVGSETTLVSRVIAPDWQRRRPVTLALVSTVIEICAMTVP